MSEDRQEESAQEFATGFSESPAQRVKIVERRNLDAHSDAIVMNNGRVIIQSVNGIEIVLGPERAGHLLALLYDHRDMFSRLAPQQQSGGSQ